jgi:hypothetical protein
VPARWSAEEEASVERLLPDYPDLTQPQPSQPSASPMAAGS